MRSSTAGRRKTGGRVTGTPFRGATRSTGLRKLQLEFDGRHRRAGRKSVHGAEWSQLTLQLSIEISATTLYQTLKCCPPVQPEPRPSERPAIVSTYSSIISWRT